VAQALADHQWISDIQGALNLEALQQYLFLWDALENVILTEEADQHVWKHEALGAFTSNSTYKAFFRGSITFEPWKRLWKSWAPPKNAIFSSGWQSGTVAGLRTDWPREVCHILISVSSVIKKMKQYNTSSQTVSSPDSSGLVCWGLLVLVILLLDRKMPSLLSGGEKASGRVGKDQKKGFNSAVMLGAWSLWVHRKNCVFEGAGPSLALVHRFFFDELKCWCLAGARELQSLGLREGFRPQSPVKTTDVT